MATTLGPLMQSNLPEMAVAKKPNLTPRIPGAQIPAAPGASAAAPSESPAAASEPAAPASAADPAAAAAGSVVDGNAQGSHGAADALLVTEGAGSPASNLDAGGEPAARAADPESGAELPLTEDLSIELTPDNVNTARQILLAHARGERHVLLGEDVSAAQFLAEFFPDSATQAAPAPVAPVLVAPAGRLPHPHEVDPAKITRKVLTTAGWVVPAPKPAEKPRF